MKGKNRIIKNMLSLGSVQLLNYILPLITMPYLVLTVGIDKYGLIGFAQAVMTYFLLVVDYGFNITATKQISIERDDKKKVSKIYSQIMMSKLFLTLICFFILLLMILVIPKMREQPTFYLLFFGIVLGNALFPIFLFQGLEEMSNIGILNFVSKMIFTIGLFAIVRSPNDINKVAILNSLGYLSIGVISQIIVRKKYAIKFEKVNWSEIVFRLKESVHLFISNIAFTTYTTSNVFVLGLMAGNTATGYFNLAYTLIRCCSTLVSPITQAFYPKISIMYETSKTQTIEFIKKMLKVITILFIVGCLILLFASGPILHIIFGDKFNHSIELIRIMSFLPLLCAWENITGTILMTITGHQKQLSKIYLLVAVLSVGILLFLTYFFQATGTAISALLTQLLLVIFLYIYLKKNKMFFIRKSEELS